MNKGRKINKRETRIFQCSKKIGYGFWVVVVVVVVVFREELYREEQRKYQVLNYKLWTETMDSQS